MEGIIDAHLNKLIEESGAGSFAVLTREDEKAERVAAIWRAYMASLSVENEIQRGRLALHNAEGTADLSPEFQATFEEATGVVRDLLDRQVFRSVNIVCPHRPRRVVTGGNQPISPWMPATRCREILSLLQAASTISDVVLVMDLDEFRSRFGDIRARSLSRILGRWASHRNPLPLVFLSSEETNADFTENLPVFFRWIPQHRLRSPTPKCFGL
ncbi:MAG: hypothetical protein IPP68_03745 [Elusimicrobia bacterium]|nr:hypothetical protein [Elusimicrobiota bacterium]